MNCGVCSATARSGSTCCRGGSSATPFSAWKTGSAPRSATVFSCLLCRACEESCPARRAHHGERAAAPPLAARGGNLMPLPVRDVAGILADNLRLRGSVLPIPARRATRWARELDLPRGGETVLYTGMMYQLIPYIERLVALEEKLGDSPLVRFSGLARRANRIVNGASLVARPRARERAEYDRVPANVARLLRRRRRRVRLPVRGRPLCRARSRTISAPTRPSPSTRGVSQRSFASTACGEVITIDPHTTHMLRTRLPEARRGLRRRSAELPRGARRARAACTARRSRARSSCTTRASTRATRTSCRAPRDLLAAAGFTVARAGERGER